MRPDLAAAFQALEPQLSWQTRAMSNGSTGFAEGHAGSRVLDRNGLEQRGGLVAGFSLVAPGVTYPEHDHPPEEIYLVLSGGNGGRRAGRGTRLVPAGSCTTRRASVMRCAARPCRCSRSGSCCPPEWCRSAANAAKGDTSGQDCQGPSADPVGTRGPLP